MSSEKTQSNDQTNDDRRRVVRNILTGAGVTVGVSSAWKEPVINSVILPAHAITTDEETTSPPDSGGEELGCCPYYFDATQSWCYDDGAEQNGNTGPVQGGFSVYNWVQPPNCPAPNN